MSDIDALSATAQNEHRLGLLIMENRSGAALAAGAAHLRNAADAWGEAQKPTRRAVCLLDLARLQARLEQHRRAAEAAAEAQVIFQVAGDREQASDAASLAALSHHACGQSAEAEARMREALAISTERNDHLRMAQHQLDLARILIARGAAYDAISVANEAREVFDDYRQQVKSAECHEQLALAFAAERDWEPARRHFEQSAQILLDLGRPFEGTEVLSRYADVEAERGDGASAVAILERCLKIQRQHGHQALQAQTWRLLGMVHRRGGDQGRAHDAYQRSLEICAQLEDAAGRARTVYQIGSLLAESGDHQQAMEQLQDSLEAAEASGNMRILERILAALAKLYRQCGAHDQALQTMHRWTEVLRDLGDRQERLRVIGSIAKVHQERGAYDEAETHLRRLISVCNPQDDAAELAFAEHGLAVILVARQQEAEAVEHFVKALDLMRSLGSDATVTRRLPQVLHQYGNCLLQLERADPALECFNELLRLPAEQVGERLRARALVGLGNAYAQIGEERRAHEFFAQAAVLCEQQGDLRATRIIRRATAEAGG